MKLFFESLIEAILILLPLLLIIAFFVYMNTYRVAAQVTSDNIEKFNELFELNEVGIEIDENVKEIVTKSDTSIMSEKFEVIYNNGEVREFTVITESNTESQNSSKLSSYIRGCSGKKDYTLFWILFFIASIINSIILITRKDEIREY